MAKSKGDGLSGLMKYASGDLWRDSLDECLHQHLGMVTDELKMDRVEFFDLVGPSWANILWDCAFEHLLTREFEPDGLNIVDEYLKRRGWNEKAPHKAYMKALRYSVISLYEVSEVVPGQSMKLRDLLRGTEPELVDERNATRSLVEGECLSARIVTVNGRSIISEGLLVFSAESSDRMIRIFEEVEANPDPDADFDVTDRDALLRNIAPLFTINWLYDALRDQEDEPVDEDVPPSR
jgi:hypothetical protein